MNKRPALERALAACKRGDVLVFYSLSRLSRSTRDVLKILDRLRKQGADLASVTESLDTSSSPGRLMLELMSAFGQFEREVLAERTRMATQYLQSQGRYIGGARPTGWVVGRGGFLEQDPAEQCLLQRARELRGAGMGLRTIAKVLLEEGFVPRQGSKFYHAQIRRWTKDISRVPVAASPAVDLNKVSA
jgi:DNA invertase Pin-like site-specific DNA recombinase